MKDRRELVIGLFAALVSIIIIGGSLIISFAERESGVSVARQPETTPSATPSATPSLTITVPTPRPGEPTLTPSVTPSPTVPSPTLPSPTSACPVPEGWRAITVQPGDTLETLAETYQTSPEALMEGNCLLIETLRPGSRLYVPPPLVSLTPTMTTTPRPTATRCAAPPAGWVQYTVKSGDTLYSLAVTYGVTVYELQAANCMGTSTVIYVGETLWVPNLPTITPTPSRTPTSTATASSTPTRTPTPTASNTATRTPRRTQPPSPTTTGMPTSTPTPTKTSQPTATSTPTATNSPTPTATNTPAPTFTSSPTSEPYPYP